MQQHTNVVPFNGGKLTATTPQALVDSLLRIKKVVERTGVPTSSTYHQIKQGTFVPPIKLGERISAWRSSEVEAIVNARIRGESDAQIKELVKTLVAARRSVGVIGGAA